MVMAETVLSAAVPVGDVVASDRLIAPRLPTSTSWRPRFATRTGRYASPTRPTPL